MKPPKMMMLLQLILIGAFGSLLLGQFVYGLCLNAIAADWIEVPGEIVGVTEAPRYATVKYVYEFKGTKYRGDTLAYAKRGSVNEREHILNTYKKGMDVSVHVCPASPRRAVLEVRESSISFFQQTLTSIATLWGFFLVVLIGYLRSPPAGGKAEEPT
ncbi:DUF3592 domain-containing protein [Aeoliella sp. ICT_H6.2]|uniref:DUF3592 domain-containing protein n=1 Tax=Aeoliella straminimaris TaxID=2954799 RepID=A0A9X2FF32_9BACT|nr:DUF3592 domain-containing protein [Aeoliella straminimaris]MCO6045109.1 DUF3592 domain-containing protein [Aeoliella straminimaris]